MSQINLSSESSVSEQPLFGCEATWGGVVPPSKLYSWPSVHFKCGELATPPHPKGVGWPILHAPLYLRGGDKTRIPLGPRGTGWYTLRNSRSEFPDSTRVGYHPLGFRQSEWWRFMTSASDQPLLSCEARYQRSYVTGQPLLGCETRDQGTYVSQAMCFRSTSSRLRDHECPNYHQQSSHRMAIQHQARVMLMDNDVRIKNKHR